MLNSRLPCFKLFSLASLEDEAISRALIARSPRKEVVHDWMAVLLIAIYCDLAVLNSHGISWRSLPLTKACFSLLDLFQARLGSLLETRKWTRLLGLISLLLIAEPSTSFLSRNTHDIRRQTVTPSFIQNFFWFHFKLFSSERLIWHRTQSCLNTWVIFQLTNWRACTGTRIRN